MVERAEIIELSQLSNQLKRIVAEGKLLIGGLASKSMHNRLGHFLTQAEALIKEVDERYLDSPLEVVLPPHPELKKQPARYRRARALYHQGLICYDKMVKVIVQMSNEEAKEETLNNFIVASYMLNLSSSSVDMIDHR